MKMATRSEPHGVRESLSVADAALRDPGDVWRLGTAEVAAALVELTGLEARTAALKAQLLVQAEQAGVDRESGCPSVAVWLAEATRTTRRSSHRAVRVAQALAECPDVAHGLAAGRLMPDQAEVIALAVTDIPREDEAVVPRIGPPTAQEAAAGATPTTPVPVRHLATDYLLDQARHHDAGALRRLASRFWEIVDPVAADARECAALEEQEKRAERKLRFSMVDHGDGTMEGWFRIPTRHGAALRTMLIALAAPKAQRARHGRGGYDPTLRSPHRSGRSFCDLIDRVTDSDLPDRGGCGATVVVTMTVESLTGQLEQAGLLDTGERISATEARRLAARAGIIPAVLDGVGMVLDWGRTRRFHTKAQRLAIATMRRTCVDRGCDVPATWCEIDHDPPWADGGGTDLTGAPRCPFHHRARHRQQGQDPPRC
ncbi:DUF222 domain-containing protein [Nocardioides sp.]|uniref:HNH endonuclease signature motif containing protein n=1 Tax=Nocardioides sp. TaxID=35761 RepID=UPI003519A8FC